MQEPKQEVKPQSATDKKKKEIQKIGEITGCSW